MTQIEQISAVKNQDRIKHNSYLFSHEKFIICIDLSNIVFGQDTHTFLHSFELEFKRDRHEHNRVFTNADFSLF